MAFTWLRRFIHSNSRPAQHRRQASRSLRAMPRMEQLEDRLVPSTLIPVTNHRDLVFDPTRRLLYITAGDGTVQQYSVQGHTLLGPLNVGVSLNGADISPDDSALYVSDSQTSAGQGLLHKANLANGAATNLPYSLAPAAGRARDVPLPPTATA